MTEFREAEYRGYLGAKGRNRTADTSIFSAVLYRLSYLGKCCSAGRRGTVYHQPRQRVNERSCRPFDSFGAAGYDGESPSQLHRGAN